MMDMIMPATGSSVASGASGGTATATATDTGGGDFLALLNALLPEVQVDGDGVDAAVGEALAELAQLGERAGDELDPGAWPIPALLARFLDPPPAIVDPQGSTSVPVDVEVAEAAPVEVPPTATAPGPVAAEAEPAEVESAEVESAEVESTEVESAEMDAAHPPVAADETPEASTGAASTEPSEVAAVAAPAPGPVVTEVESTAVNGADPLATAATAPAATAPAATAPAATAPAATAPAATAATATTATGATSSESSDGSELVAADASGGVGRGAVRGDADGRGRPDTPPSLAVAAAARAAADDRTQAMNPGASERPREPSTGAAERTGGGPLPADTSTLIDGLRSVAPAESEASLRDVDAARGANARSTTASAASVQRVLDAVELLEKAPPPRHLTLELADGRLRVAIEEGQVRLSLLGERGEDASQLLDDARAALEDRGFDLGGDQSSDDQDQPGDGASAPGASSRSASPRVAAGLRL